MLHSEVMWWATFACRIITATSATRMEKSPNTHLSRKAKMDSQAVRNLQKGTSSPTLLLRGMTRNWRHEKNFCNRHQLIASWSQMIYTYLVDRKSLFYVISHSKTMCIYHKVPYLLSCRRRKEFCRGWDCEQTHLVIKTLAGKCHEDHSPTPTAPYLGSVTK